MDAPLNVILVVIPLILLWIAALADAFSRSDLSWPKKIAWAVAILLLPFLGVALYFIARPPNPPEGKRYGDEEPRTTAVVDTLENLRAQHAAGELSDEAYLAAKRQAMGLTDQPSS